MHHTVYNTKFKTLRLTSGTHSGAREMHKSLESDHVKTIVKPPTGFDHLYLISFDIEDLPKYLMNLL